MLCRCRSALVTETRPLSAPSVARPRPVESEVGIAPSRELVEQLEAQLPPDSFDDARVLLEKLQQDIHRQGTSTGLNGERWSWKHVPGCAPPCMRRASIAANGLLGGSASAARLLKLAFASLRAAR